MKKILVLSIFTTTIFAGSYSTSSNWLLEAETEQKKFELIQNQFRGFDLAMMEVGYRFNNLYYALKEKNYKLADYHLEKIKKAIENGVQRRPKRKNNSDFMFLDTQWKIMKQALESEDKKSIWIEYENTKKSCNTCHVAENVPFIKVQSPEASAQLSAKGDSK
jgi:hypothetical protein